MSEDREATIEERLAALRNQEAVMLFTELLTLRRKRHRDKLEAGENPEMRGRAKECKDLLHVFG